MRARALCSVLTAAVEPGIEAGLQGNYIFWLILNPMLRLFRCFSGHIWSNYK